jgi:HSP20 family molecular chaperone IbpA
MFPFFYDTKYDNSLIKWISSNSTLNDQFKLSLDNATHPIDIEFEVPGFKKSDFKINLTDNWLNIYAETEKRKFVKVMTIDSNQYDTEKISVTLENGILHLTVPLLETKKSKPVTIEIK